MKPKTAVQTLVGGVRTTAEASKALWISDQDGQRGAVGPWRVSGHCGPGWRAPVDDERPYAAQKALLHGLIQ